jgi:hypothetical protein
VHRVRLMIARCSIGYAGRLPTCLPGAARGTYTKAGKDTELAGAA